MGKGFLSLTLRTVMSLRYFCSHVNKSNFVTQCFFWQDCSLKPGEKNLQFQHPVYATNMLSLSGQRQSLGKHWCFGYASFMAASKLHNLIVFHSILPPSWTRIEKTRYFSQLPLILPTYTWVGFHNQIHLWETLIFNWVMWGGGGAWGVLFSLPLIYFMNRQHVPGTNSYGSSFLFGSSPRLCGFRASNCVVVSWCNDAWVQQRQRFSLRNGEGWEDTDMIWGKCSWHSLWSLLISPMY